MKKQLFKVLPALFVLLVLCLSAIQPVQASRPVRIIFLHHSTGANLIEQGGVLEMFRGTNYDFNDHGYNGDGLRTADGNFTGTNFDVPDDNTDPDGLAAIFSQPYTDPPSNTFSHLMQYDVIIFKSCFPTSNIGSDGQLEEYKQYYYTIRNRIDQYPDKLFIPFTPPPQVPGASNREEALRARAFADWLTSPEFTEGHPNMRVFNFFDLLAGNDNFLKSGYRDSNDDAHPNYQANEDIAPIFVQFVMQASDDFFGSGGPSGTPAVMPTAGTAPTPVALMGGPTFDFDRNLGEWEPNTDGTSTISCTVDPSMSFFTPGALRVEYTVPSNGWAGCGSGVGEGGDWSHGAGLMFGVYGGAGGEEMTMVLVAGDESSNAPFEASFSIPGEAVSGWQQIVIPFDQFQRASWADPGGPDVFDPAHVLWLGFSLNAYDPGYSGTLYLDDFQIQDREMPPLPPEATSVPGDGGGGGGGPNCRGTGILVLLVLSFTLWRFLHRA